MSFIKIKVYNSEEEVPQEFERPLSHVNTRKISNIENDLISSAAGWFRSLRFIPTSKPKGKDLLKSDWDEVLRRIKEVISLPNLVDSIIFIGVDNETFSFYKFNDR